ncbi:MAG: EAL domain-containing protein [Sulfurovum sp.]|nr:EAL domain-containing protein [Sulfurovum sp.]
MTSVDTYYSDEKALDTFIVQERISNSSSLLIQVFTANNSNIFIETLSALLMQKFPDAILMGSTTDGEIMSGQVSTFKTVINFTTFYATTLRCARIIHQKDGYYSGQYLAQNLIEEDTKLLIAFTTGLNTNGEAFLEGIASVNNTVMVAGGMAGDNATFTQTYVFSRQGIVNQGAVGVALNSRTLQVYNDYSFNWHRVGKLLTITKVEANRVYTIDNQTAVATYSHYLGKDMEEGLPAVGIEFPLISVRNGVSVARAVLAKHDDGSLSFAGNLNKGDKVQFGYGDPQEILKYSKNMFAKVNAYPSEAIFVYSCMARRHFMSDIIERETLCLTGIAPVSGFFTYGEFFTSDKYELLNQSMTLVSLSESTTIVKDRQAHQPNTIVSKGSTRALVHLVNVTSAEANAKEIFIQTQSIFEKLFQTSADGILLIENTLSVECNQKMLDLFGYESKAQFLTMSLKDIMPQRQGDGSESLSKMQEMQDLAVAHGHHHFEWLHSKKNGEDFWTDIMLTSIDLHERKLLYMVCRDISQKKQIELELEAQKKILYHQAYHDSLTGLPNRALFMRELKKSLEKAKVEGTEVALMFIDLDRFKQVNDSLGHGYGDMVISIIAKRLQLVIANNDIVSRLGGDEFLVLLPDVKDATMTQKKTQKILSIIKEPIVLEPYTLYSSASIGISRYPIDGVDADNLLRYADAAMYKAKDEGGNTFECYSKDMTEVPYDHMMMERDLRDSIKLDHFEVYYQPQIHIKTGKIIGAEALVRWNHPTVGFLAPYMFIPLAVKTGLIIELGLWVMNQAMMTFAQWYKEGLSPGVLALNVSAKQLEYPDFIKEMTSTMAKHGVKEAWVELELTETEVMTNPKKVIKILEKLQKIGISIAIDDFGTGYSSLSYLKHLPIDKLKIDQSFIADISADNTAQAIVHTIIVLANSLNLAVIAEGVETKTQERFLAMEGCEYAQGYYYDKPLTQSKFKALLAKQG